MVPSVAPGCQPVSSMVEDKVSELSEDDVTVSLCHELDLKTVGDIIAIIEEKVLKVNKPYCLDHIK